MAKFMLERFQNDTTSYAEIENKATKLKLKFFQKSEVAQYMENPTSDNFKNAIAHVVALQDKLRFLYQQESLYLDAAIETACKQANFIPGISSEPKGKETPAALLQRVSYGLYRCSGKEVTFWFEYLVASLLSSNGDADLKLWNPHLTPEHIAQVYNLTVDTLLHSVRLGQVSQCLSDLKDFLNLLKKVNFSFMLK